MKKILFIRHAESEGNVGDIVFPHGHVIKITEKGKKQSTDLAEILDKPDRIIVSKYIRTIETAEPTIRKFPETDVHLWLDIHEFGSVCPENITGKSVEDARKLYTDYWQKADPFFKDSEHVESFKEFVDRLRRVIFKLKKIDNGLNYIFTHGWVIKLFYNLTRDFKDSDFENNDQEIYNKVMKVFIEKDAIFKTQNTGVYDMTELVEKYGENVI